jgi:hypothetical protein
MPGPETIVVQLRRRLIAAQNSDGGWGYAPGKESRLEPTSWVFRGLVRTKAPPEVIARALAWLLAQQRPDGSFISAPTAEFSQWQTSLVYLALKNYPEEDETVQEAIHRAFQAIVRDQAQATRRKNEAMGGDLVGWGWTNNAFSWVEPTAYGLICLNSIGGQIETHPDSKKIIFRKEQAESILAKRRCADGGWNYGNTTSSDYALGSFPVPTALVLLALADRAQSWDLAPAWETLEKLLAKQATLFGLSLALLAAMRHFHPAHHWAVQISAHLETLPSQANFGQGLALEALTSF